MKRADSANIHYQRRIPADVLSRARGQRIDLPIGRELVPFSISAKAVSIRVSLRTADEKEARARASQVGRSLGALWDALRQVHDEPPLTTEEAFALAGELRDAWLDDRRLVAVRADGADEPPEDAARLEALAELEAVNAIDSPEAVRPLATTSLRRKGIRRIDEGSVLLLCRALIEGLKDAFAVRLRRANGDFSIPPKPFPRWTRTGQSPSQGLRALYEDWWREAEKVGKARGTYRTYRNTIERLVEFLGHEDVERITANDIVAFKDHRLAIGRSWGTINSVDLGCLRSIFGWAVANHRLSNNPASGVKVQRSTLPPAKPKDFTAQESAAILRASLSVDPKQRVTGGPGRAGLARRWVPWLCAYTGARVGEIVQLRGQDFREVPGLGWAITITPEAGTVKDKKVREVLLHPHLIDQGITALARSGDGPVFLKEGSDAERTVMTSHVAKFARLACPTLSARPNHGWRHLFKTIGREAGIADSVLDAICGHAAKTVGGSYGGVTLKAQHDAMAKFPKFDLGKAPPMAG